MCRQSQCSVGSSVSSYLSSSSLNWELARLRIPIWIIIISLLQGTVPVSPLHNSLRHSAGKRPLGCAARRPMAVHLICSTQSLHLFCIVPLVQSSQESRKFNVCLLSCLALKFNISFAGGQLWQWIGDRGVSSALNKSMKSLLRFGTWHCKL